METVQLVSDVRLPTLIRRHIEDLARRCLSRHTSRFGFSQVTMHLKHDGPQIACNVKFVTDDGRYIASVSGWDVRALVQDALECIDAQVVKHFEKRAVYA